LPWNVAIKGPDFDSSGFESSQLTTSVSSTGGAYHLVSSLPVTVYQFNALEYAGQGGPSGKSWASCPGGSTCYSYSNDASLLLPSTAMTGNYRIMTIEGGYFAVTGTQNGTNVTVTLSTTATVAGGGSIQSAGPGQKVTFTLNAGDVAEILPPPSGTADLSGSLLQANQPVQVISGIACTAIGNGVILDGGIIELPSCDHVEESVFPAETLGKHYVVTVPTAPEGQPIGHEVRFFGNVDQTTLTYVPSTPPGCPTTLNAGMVVDCGIVSVDFEVKGDHEFGVASLQESAQVVDPNAVPPAQEGDPSMSFATAVEQYRTSYIFLAPTDYEVNYADVVILPGTTLTLDGVAVSTAPVPIDSQFSVVRLKIPNGTAHGAHTIAGSTPFGIQVLGYGSYTSYQYPGGLDLGQIAPPPK
jgi:hypothetical protein